MNIILPNFREDSKGVFLMGCLTMFAWETTDNLKVSVAVLAWAPRDDLFSAIYFIEFQIFFLFFFSFS